MKPEIEIVGISIKTFGVMFALGFLACGVVIARRLRELGKPVAHTFLRPSVRSDPEGFRAWKSSRRSSRSSERTLDAIRRVGFGASRG